MHHSDLSTPTASTPETWRKRENLLPGLALVVITAVAWVYTIYHATMSITGNVGMEDMPMTEGMGTTSALTLFLFSWTVMMVAMMLPAMLPLILLYRLISLKRMGRYQSLVGTTALVAGYVVLWAIAGLPVFAYELAMTGARSTIMLLLPSLLLIGGGAYQFTALKHGCHTRCSNPLSFLMQRWQSGASGALRLGVLHGIDCLGCCAGLMVGLVALGMMNLALMLSAAVIIFIEKTLPGGHRVARPLGVLMIVGGVVLLAASLFSGQETMSM